jgi:hypothetical protein
MKALKRVFGIGESGGVGGQREVRESSSEDLSLDYTFMTSRIVVTGRPSSREVGDFAMGNRVQ